MFCLGCLFHVWQGWEGPPEFPAYLPSRCTQSQRLAALMHAPWCLACNETAICPHQPGGLWTKHPNFSPLILLAKVCGGFGTPEPFCDSTWAPASTSPIPLVPQVVSPRRFPGPARVRATASGRGWALLGRWVDRKGSSLAPASLVPCPRYLHCPAQ